MLEKKEYTLTFITELLGTVPKNKEIYQDFVIKKAVDKGIDVNGEDEIETVEEIEESGWTGFHKNGNGIFLYDYMLKGNIKANMETLIQAKTIAKISAYKQAVDRMVMIYPRHIPIMNESGSVNEPSGVIERPLRCMTMRGPRVSLTKSDYINIGSFVTCEIALLPNPKISWDIIEKALDYGQFYGIGQWRGSGGYGRYEWEKVR